MVLDKLINERIEKKNRLALLLTHKICPDCGNDLELEYIGSSFGNEHEWRCDCGYKIKCTRASQIIDECASAKKFDTRYW